MNPLKPDLRPHQRSPGTSALMYSAIRQSRLTTRLFKTGGIDVRLSPNSGGIADMSVGPGRDPRRTWRLSG